MPRYAVPGAKLGHVYAEIRPDRPVTTGPPTRHWHADPEEGKNPPPKVLEELRAGTDAKTMLKTTEAFRQHCRRVDKQNEGTDAPPHETVEGMHTHPDEAKYVFPPSAKMDVVERHHHSSDFYTDFPEELDWHNYYWHTNPDYVEGDASGWHTHKRRVKDHSNSLAKRLDIHPMALEKLESASLVYFALEGVLKADAILSAIIREGRNESVFDVPSVSLWHADELKEFARTHLKGKTVVIVPDADWIDNDLVIAHARSCELFLKRQCDILDCYIAAPPLDTVVQDGEEKRVIKRNAAGDKLKGVDDYLAEGYSLNTLEVMERSPSPKIYYERKRVEDLSRYRDGRKYRRDGLNTAERVITKLSYMANRDGYVKTAHSKLGEIMDVVQSTVTERIKFLMELGWLTAEIKVQDVWQPAEGVPATKYRYVSVEGLHIYTSEDWRDTTRLIIRKDLRAIDGTPKSLGDIRERLAQTRGHLMKAVAWRKAL
jgi:hypothetical protein